MQKLEQFVQKLKQFMDKNLLQRQSDKGQLTEALSILMEAEELIADAKNVLVVTGAGISTDSGIPDFRGPDGVWTKHPEAEKASHIDYYMNDPEIRKKNWRLLASGELWSDIKPNDGHLALLGLEKEGKLHTLITQNVDGLHHAAGTDPDKIVEIHGNIREAICLSCDWRDNIESVLARVRGGEEDPRCDCGGLLKTATIFFGQMLVPKDLERMFDALEASDLLLAIGTSLEVSPVNSVVPGAVEGGKKIVIVNGEPTSMDVLADVTILGSISEVLPWLLDNQNS